MKHEAGSTTSFSIVVPIRPLGSFYQISVSAPTRLLRTGMLLERTRSTRQARLHLCLAVFQEFQMGGAIPIDLSIKNWPRSVIRSPGRLVNIASEAEPTLCITRRS